MWLRDCELPRSRSSFGTESSMISGWSLWRTFHSATGQGRSGSLKRLLAGAHMFLKLPMQLMPKSCPCGRLGVGCKVKTVYKFCASFLAFCKCFKQAPILYSLIKAFEDSQLPPLAPTLDSDRSWEFKPRSHVMASCHSPGKKRVYPRWPRTRCHGICHPGLLTPAWNSSHPLHKV